MPSLSRRSFLVGATGAVVLAACGDDGDSSAGPGTSSTDVPSLDPTTPPDASLDGQLPPVDALALEPLFRDGLAALGLSLTNRGGLIDTRNGQYVQSATGNHVALYAEPVDPDYSTERFVQGLLDLTVLTAPVIFERWPALESYDICQEPLDADDPSPEPIPATQIAMTNEQVAAIDWDTVTLADLLYGFFNGQEGVEIINVSSVVASHPDYLAASDEARSRL